MGSSWMACVNLWAWEQISSSVCDEIMRSSVYFSVVRMMMRVVAGWLAERVCVCLCLSLCLEASGRDVWLIARLWPFSLLRLVSGSNADYTLLRGAGAEPLYAHAGLTQTHTHMRGDCISTQPRVTCLLLRTDSGGGDRFHSLLLPLLLSAGEGKQCHGIPLWSRGGQNKRRPVFRRPLLRLQRMWKQ